jgi:hypothetical protein
VTQEYAAVRLSLGAIPAKADRRYGGLIKGLSSLFLNSRMDGDRRKDVATVPSFTKKCGYRECPKPLRRLNTVSTWGLQISCLILSGSKVKEQQEL